ncbi:hypothetical protein ABID20_004941 [Rhizobium alvei]
MTYPRRGVGKIRHEFYGNTTFDAFSDLLVVRSYPLVGDQLICLRLVIGHAVVFVNVQEPTEPPKFSEKQHLWPNIVAKHYGQKHGAV